MRRKLCALYAYDQAEKESSEGKGAGEERVKRAGRITRPRPLEKPVALLQDADAGLCWIIERPITESKP